MRKALKIIAVNLGLLLAVTVAAELVFGGWIGTNYGTLVIPKDFKRRFEVGDLYPSETPYIRFVRDEHGLRGDYGTPADIDLLTIGGSTTNEIFIDEGKTWTATLGRLLGPDVRVANAGVDGQSTVGHIKNFELWFPKIPGLAPDYVLAFVGINDYALAQFGHMAKQDHMEAPEHRRLKRFLMNNSALYTLFRNVRGMLRAREADLVHQGGSLDGTDWTLPGRQPDVEAKAAEMAAQLDAYGERLRALVGHIRALGAEAILVTQAKGTYRIDDRGRVLGRPQADGTVDTAPYAGLTAFNRRTMRVCAELAAVCIDLAAELRFQDGDHYDGLHTTPTGSAKIGRFLAERLKGRLRFD